MEVRQAKAEDTADVVRLMKQLEAFAHGTVGLGVEGRFKFMLTLSNFNVCVAEDDDQVIGLITASLRPTLWHAG
ncbi:MAG: hypothetical protein ACE5F6_12325, partial [Anaerolineae bacterium]